jgi:hypothetical protein
MPNPQYNPGGMPSNPTGYIHQIPPQQTPISTYPQGYGNQPLFMGNTATSQRPPSTQGQAQQQYTKPKGRTIISIVDPNSGKDLTAEILKTTQSSTEVTGSSDSGSRSTPVGNTEVRV